MGYDMLLVLLCCTFCDNIVLSCSKWPCVATCHPGPYYFCAWHGFAVCAIGAPGEMTLSLMQIPDPVCGAAWTATCCSCCRRGAWWNMASLASSLRGPAALLRGWRAQRRPLPHHRLLGISVASAARARRQETSLGSQLPRWRCCAASACRQVCCMRQFWAVSAAVTFGKHYMCDLVGFDHFVTSPTCCDLLI